MTCWLQLISPTHPPGVIMLQYFGQVFIFYFFLFQQQYMYINIQECTNNK